jgi:hypothetical protein
MTSTPVLTDGDGDGVADNVDNCPSIVNNDQANSDALARDNGPDVAGNDDTVPNADALGDACDADDDNDGLADDDEEPLVCGAFTGAGAVHSSPARGDVTNDDNGDGEPAPIDGTDVADDGASWDTDADGVLDGYECVHGSNPRDAASLPPAEPGAIDDDDGDGLLNGWELRGWGTDPAGPDGDGDGLGDCKEALDLDGDGIVTFAGDTIAIARAASLPDVGRTTVFDVNKDGLTNFAGDAIGHASRAVNVISCV